MKIGKRAVILYIIWFTTSMVVFGGAQKIQSYKAEVERLESLDKKESNDKAELINEIKILNKHFMILKNEIETGAFKEKVHFNENNITEVSGVTREQLVYAFKDTKLVEYVDTFIEVEEQYGINALFMAGLVANESGWLNSNRAVSQNNVTGYAVYEDSSEGRTFASIEESILVTAETLHEHYIDEKGQHHKGLATSDINIMYSADKDWCVIVNSIAKRSLESINSFTDLLY